jgi:hypothetical protein
VKILNIEDMKAEDVVVVAASIALDIMTEEKSMEMIRTFHTMEMDAVSWMSLIKTMMKSINTMTPDDLANLKEDKARMEASMDEHGSLQQPTG